MLFPNRRRFLLAAAGLGATLANGGCRRGGEPVLPSTAEHRRFDRISFAMGTKVAITVMHPDAQQATDALAAAFAAIEQVEAQLSIYRPQSQVSRLNQTGRLVQPHAHLLAVLQHACETSQMSAGAFDITVQPLWEQFALAQRQGRLPTSDEIASARAYVDWRRVEMDSRAIRLTEPGTKITLNGIAQGYAADQALLAVRQHGIEHALIDTGELAARGDKLSGGLSGGGWRVGVQHPRHSDALAALAQLKDRCLSTSGDYATTFSSDRRHHHIFDPSTGIAPSELASVSVAAPTAMQADAWSTACFVLGAERSAEILNALPGHDALFILKDGSQLATPDFPLVQEEVAS